MYISRIQFMISLIMYISRIRIRDITNSFHDIINSVHGITN